MRIQTLVALAGMVFLAWQIITFWRPDFKVRVARGFRAVAIIYLVVLAARLAASPPDSEQLQTGGLALAFFGGLWAVAWLVARSIKKQD